MKKSTLPFLLLTTLATLLPLPLVSAPAAAKTNPAPKLDVQEAPITRDVKARTSFAPIVKKVAPSVVNIYSTVIIHGGTSMLNPFSDDPSFRRQLPDDLRRFFGEDDDNSGSSRRNRRPREHKSQSLGSGVIISPDGYILTANHVIEGAEKVKVALASGAKEFEAKVIGADPPTDVALLKIDGKGLPAITIADSDKLEVGDTVLAIGNPFAVGQTVTMGIVSAVSRGGFGINAYEDFIQTDAAINVGNSGGALVDAEGRLVGINTAILSRSGGNMGVGFAVPANIARYVMDRITKEGKVTRGYLGLSLQPEMTPELVTQFHLPDMNGALATSVEPDSPAAKAGFKEGDFVTEFNGKKVNDMRQLRLIVSQTAPGAKVNVKLIRDGKERSLTATLAEFPEELLAMSGTGRDQNRPRSHGQSSMDALDGVEVTDIDSSARRQESIPNNIHGALVTSVDPDSNAAEAGLQPGDVLIEINRKSVRGADDAVALSDKEKTNELLLRVWRAGRAGGRGGMFYITVDNTKHK